MCQRTRVQTFLCFATNSSKHPNAIVAYDCERLLLGRLAGSSRWMAELHWEEELRTSVLESLDVCLLPDSVQRVR